MFDEKVSKTGVAKCFVMHLGLLGSGMTIMLSFATVFIGAIAALLLLGAFVLEFLGFANYNIKLGEAQEFLLTGGFAGLITVAVGLIVAKFAMKVCASLSAKTDKHTEAEREIAMGALVVVVLIGMVIQYGLPTLQVFLYLL